jgi:hypothetical protein
MMVDEQATDEPIKRTFAKWLFGQEANTIALFLILGGLGWFVYYLLNTGVPAHLQQIHQGYKEINDSNNKSRDDDRVMFEKTLDRIEKVYASKPPRTGD